ncbi:MAG: SH3 domain-containing protein [Proteobacteria bacterium]|nr:SH3 domain-containing protein [Pseudomonadota bacterium]
MAKATVTASNGLNVRKGPGTNYSKLGSLTYKTTVDVLSTTNGWHQINYSGQKGYICSQYTSYSGDSSSSSGSKSSSENSSGSGSGTLYTVTASSLNVRKGAGTSYGILGQLSGGTTVTALGESSGWLKISFKDQTGWISKKYTKVGGSSSGGSNSSSSSGSDSATAKTGVVTAAALNVRKGAGTSYGILGTLSNGDSFSYTQESNGWLKISYKDGTGWISKKHTTVGGGSTGGSSSGSGGAASDKMKEAGQKAANKANSLYSQYRSEGWTYSQAYRSSTGHYDCSSFCHRCWSAAGVNFGWGSSEGEALKCYNAGGTVNSVQNVIPGDLLFYHTNWNSGTRWKGINHVAIAISGSQRVDAGGTPVKKKDLGSPVYIGRPGYLL